MGKNKTYDEEYKIQAVKLGLEIGAAKAVRELGISSNTLYTWIHRYRQGDFNPGAGTQTPQNAMTLCEEVQPLRKQMKEQPKEIKRLREENEFLEEASAFFAASRRKSARTKESSSLH